ncbi:proteinase-activated receptor 4 [Trichechus manatus latirostris]|uniref:Proteinase-activated receptor 4 n=1 Tax=Trichechus manatus latirostris TaxID=127582 RepID=A0A2Y9RSJ1_TRIMA|nr:proteinase-activated receptor 4 [Trichechus manatus latirostris]
MLGLLLLGALILGLNPAGDTRTPSVYDETSEDWSTGVADDHPEVTAPHPPCPRSFPGRLCSNDSNTLLLPDSSQTLLLGWVPTRLVPVLYALALTLGVPANGLALWVLATRVPRLPSTLLLANLAAADLLLGLALPPRIIYHLRGQRWPFGEAACRLATAALYGHMYGSLLLLAAVALDRYLAVVHPLRVRALRGLGLATGLCAAAWLAATALSLPLALQRQTFWLAGAGSDHHLLCHDALPQEAQLSHWRPAFACLALLGCFTPLLAMVLCYGATLRALAAGGRRYGHARRLAALVLASALAFFVPSNVLLLLHYSDPGPRAWGNLYAAYLPSLALSTLNSCVDPFVYYYVSAEFREKVRHALRRLAPGNAGGSSKASGEGGGAGTGTPSTSLV